MVDAAIDLRRSRWRVALAVLILCLSSTAALVTAAEPAHAYCGGVGQPGTFYGPVVGGVSRGALAADGICNGNGYYAGLLYDLVKDGRGVYLYLCETRDGPCSPFYEGGAGSAPTQVSRSDQNGDGKLLARLRWGSESSEVWMTGF